MGFDANGNWTPDPVSYTMPTDYSGTTTPVGQPAGLISPDASGNPYYSNGGGMVNLGNSSATSPTDTTNNSFNWSGLGNALTSGAGLINQFTQPGRTTAGYTDVINGINNGVGMINQGNHDDDRDNQFND